MIHLLIRGLAVPRILCLAMALVAATRSGKTQPAQIQQVCSSLERAQAKLVLLIQTLAQGDPSIVSITATNYLKEFSQFHTRLGRPQAGNEEESFLAGLVNRLERQGNEVQQLAENGQHGGQTALNEAVKPPEKRNPDGRTSTAQ